MHSILIGLKSGGFSKSSTKRIVEIMTELLAQLAKFINMKEVEVAKEQVDQPLE